MVKSSKAFGLLCLVTMCSTVPATQENSTVTSFRKAYSACDSSDNLFSCIKIQALKLAERALRLPAINIIDGLSIVRSEDAIEPRNLEDNSENTGSLSHAIRKLSENYQIEVDIPRLLSKIQTQMVEEGRGKDKKNKYMGPFLAAMAIKGGILTMVYHSIAIIAGKALIIGKIALVISAIIGLKKLVQPEGHEKTTYEIVKHPHVSQSHTFSTSHGDFDAHEGGQYHRSLDDKMVMQDRAYKGYAKHFR